MTDQRVPELGSLLTQAGIGVWTWDPASDTVIWDAEAERIYGLEEGGFDGTMEAFVSFIHPADAEDVLELLDKVGRTGGLYSVQHRIVWPDGTIRWVEGQGRIETGSNGGPQRGYGIVYDVTDRATLERERDQLRVSAAAAVRSSTANREALDFIIHASDALAGSLNTERLLERLATVMTDDFADFCIVDLKLDEPVGWLMTGARNAASSKYASEAGGPSAMLNARRRLEQADVGSHMDDPTAWLVLDTEELGGIVPDAVSSILVEPLTSRGRTIGSLLVGRTIGAWAPETREILQAVARRAAVALDQAELYRDRSAVADVFQRAMIPSTLPEVAGVSLGVLYRPATELIRLGGDLYDVFPTPAGGCMLVVGDVCGKGVVAAGHAGLARSALRAAAQATGSPAEALGVLNRTLLADPTRPLITAVVVEVGPAEQGGSRTATVSCAGHPMPLAIRKDGRIESIPASGTMLGFDADPSFSSVPIRLDPGDAIAMFSDGVVETRRGKEFFGSERLIEALTTVISSQPSTMVDAVGATLDTWTAEPMADDIVMLVAKVDQGG